MNKTQFGIFGKIMSATATLIAIAWTSFSFGEKAGKTIYNKEQIEMHQENTSLKKSLDSLYSLINDFSEKSERISEVCDEAELIVDEQSFTPIKQDKEEKDDLVIEENENNQFAKGISASNLLTKKIVRFRYNYIGRKIVNGSFTTFVRVENKVLYVSLVPTWSSYGSSSYNRLVIDRADIQLYRGKSISILQSKGRMIHTKGIHLVFNMKKQPLKEKGEIHIPIEYVSKKGAASSNSPTKYISTVKVEYELK